MNKAMPELIQLKIKMSAIVLGSTQLDNLASEFYGHIPNISTIAANVEEISVIFHDVINPVEKTIIFSATDCRSALRNALDSFKTPLAPST